jgi:hypothetical protein
MPELIAHIEPVVASHNEEAWQFVGPKASSISNG